MRVEDEAAFVSVVARIAHLEEAVRQLPIPQFVPEAERGAAIAALVELTAEIDALTREAGRLLRALEGTP